MRQHSPELSYLLLLYIIESSDSNADLTS